MNRNHSILLNLLEALGVEDGYYLINENQIELYDFYRREKVATGFKNCIEYLVENEGMKQGH